MREQEEAALKAMGECRKAMMDLHRAFKSRSGISRNATYVVDAIDDLATIITGNKTYYHRKPHSTSFGPREG